MHRARPVIDLADEEWRTDKLPDDGLRIYAMCLILLDIKLPPNLSLGTEEDDVGMHSLWIMWFIVSGMYAPPPEKNEDLWTDLALDGLNR